jgi:hypothetical protein
MTTKTTTNPVFAPERLALELADPARVERMHHDPRSIDLLIWNVFATFAGHRDQPWLASRLRILGGPALRDPLRLSLWSGRDRQPQLRPNAAYVASVRERMRAAGADDAAIGEAIGSFEAPVEAAVRIESPEVLCLVDAHLDGYPLGAGGRDRLVELIDAGLDAAQRVGKQLAVAVVYPSGLPFAGELSARVRTLQDPAGLRAALSHRATVPAVTLREVSWQQLLKVWEAERDWLPLDGEPAKAFLEHCAALGLR